MSPPPDILPYLIKFRAVGNQHTCYSLWSSLRLPVLWLSGWAGHCTSQTGTCWWAGWLLSMLLQCFGEEGTRARLCTEEALNRLCRVGEWIMLFKKKILFIFRARVGAGEREGEKKYRSVASRMPPTGDLAHNPGMCPDWELNLWPFGLQACPQSTEPHQPGLWILLFKYTNLMFLQLKNV